MTANFTTLCRRFVYRTCLDFKILKSFICADNGCLINDWDKGDVYTLVALLVKTST